MMAWIYLDDHWDENAKLLAIYEDDPRALVLYLSGLAFCRRSGSPDGVIPAAKVRGLLGWRPRSQAALIAARPPTGAPAWSLRPDGAVVVHDYAEWNRASTSRSASARNAARVRWGRERNA
jgi:hypothetical protein